MTMMLGLKAALTSEEELVRELEEAIQEYKITQDFNKLLIPAQILLLKKIVGDSPAGVVELADKFEQTNRAVDLLNPNLS